MSGQQQPPPRGGGLSLYANLLGSGDKNSSSITGAPVTYAQGKDGSAQQGDAAAKRPFNNGAFRFQPTKRPQIAPQKAKIKASSGAAFSKVAPRLASSAVPGPSSTSPDSSARAYIADHQQRPPQPATTSSLADWTNDPDDDAFFAGPKRQRGGRKKKNKRARDRDDAGGPEPTNWDDIYDPTRPTNYHEWKESDARFMVEREWKDILYAHRVARKKGRASSEDVTSGEERTPAKGGKNPMFAPPSNYNFAPPPSFDNGSLADAKPTAPAPPSPPPAPPPAEVPYDATGEDPYTRRLRMSQGPPAQATITPPAGAPPPPPPPPPYPSEQVHFGGHASTVQSSSRLTTPPPPPPPPGPPPTQQYDAPKPASAGATISRAAVTYELPPPPADLPATEEEFDKMLEQEEQTPDRDAEDGSAGAASEAPRSNRPGQLGFAERLMAKYGYKKGQGLGASGTGILKPLQVKAEKRKQRPDSEGGGFVDKGGARGKIIGGKRGKGADAEGEEGRFGKMSEVVVVRGMVAGKDLSRPEELGGLMQEIGDQCGSKYGRVERVFIDRESGKDVYVKFTSQLSALRAVNALDENTFDGNPVQARFYDTEKFEDGVFE